MPATGRTRGLDLGHLEEFLWRLAEALEARFAEQPTPRLHREGHAVVIVSALADVLGDGRSVSR